MGEVKVVDWFQETLRACIRTRRELLGLQRELAQRDSDVNAHMQKSLFAYLEKKLRESVSLSDREVEKLAVTLYPEYRNLLHELNKGEPTVIYARYHGYCEESTEAMRMLQPRIGTSYKVRLLPVVPNAIRGRPLNLRPVTV